jgi:hypothetical protein
MTVIDITRRKKCLETGRPKWIRTENQLVLPADNENPEKFAMNKKLQTILATPCSYVYCPCEKPVRQKYDNLIHYENSKVGVSEVSR